jgi:hypothetical protein
MNLDELTLGQIKQIKTLVGNQPDDTAFEVGKAYLIRSVTLYYTGRITRITSKELVLEDAAWIADTGRFYDCLKDNKFNEVEPFISPIIIPRDSIIDATEWKHQLPRDQI